MIAFLKIAFRNLIKNRRRSMFTILAIALGFSAVSLFGGFANYMYVGNRGMAIFGTCNGHLLIFKKGYLERGQIDPSKYLISSEELKSIKDVCHELPEVIHVAPQLMISGLVSNGRVSTIFVAQGIRPSEVDVFWNNISEEFDAVVEENKLKNDKAFGVAVTTGLAGLLDLKIGSDAVAFTNTVEGQMNALDMEVVQLFDTDYEPMNDKVMRVPLTFAQSLYDTDGVDRIAVLLSQYEQTELVRDKLQKLLHGMNSEFEIKTWVEMSQWYRKVKEMFDVIFAFLFIIVFIIVITSVVNTMSMAVIERTREIGTMRALGLKRKGVTALFSIESILLGILGTANGLVFTFLGSWAIDLIKPTWIPPGIAKRVPIMIFFPPGQMFLSFLFLMLLCIMASLFPARRAARQNVVDALGHI